jgi:DNA-binding transcriptional regulator YiaG
MQTALSSGTTINENMRTKSLTAMSYHFDYRTCEVNYLKPFSRIQNPRDIRKKLGINQMDFWSKLGVTQSGGSRYESGRAMPKPVRELLRLVYVKHVPLADANGSDLRIAELLRETKPALYAQLRARVSKDS